MVAVINTSTSLYRSFYYNEQKVKAGIATCIAAVNYPKDVSQLTPSQKLNRLLKQAALNENVKRNSVHISLNFDPTEKDLSILRLTKIADVYMEKIGFGKQPYLVYQHHDAGHPHIHIVTLKVRGDGSRIDTQNIGRNQSEKARKEIEKIFGLIQADAHKRLQTDKLKPIHARQIQYGKGETKRAIANVLAHVLNTYKYTSLPELNAVLLPFNIMADGGERGSRTYLKGGLIYRVLDAQGNKVGVPIKASDFYSKPTLKFLQEKFVQHKLTRQPYKARIKNVVDLTLLKQSHHTLQSLIQVLKTEGIDTIIRQNEEGLIYGLTYVDHHTKCVFNGSDLGKAYSAKGLQDRCGRGRQLEPNANFGQSDITLVDLINSTIASQQQGQKDHTIGFAQTEELVALLQPLEEANDLPIQLLNSKKKRRKRNSKQL